MKKALSERQKKARDQAQARYDAANTTRVVMKLNNKTDSDILAKLASVDNKQAYIKALIRNDLNKIVI